MLVTVQNATSMTTASFRQQSTSIPQNKSQLVATWIMENNRLVCKWLTR